MNRKKVITRRKPQPKEIVCAACEYRYEPKKQPKAVSGFIACPNCGHYLNKEDYLTKN